MESQEFWAVCGRNCEHLETFTDAGKAEDVAKLNAANNPGKTFYVLKATHAACTQTPVAFVETDDGIPF